MRRMFAACRELVRPGLNHGRSSLNRLCRLAHRSVLPAYR
jgi:hypothetical protein